MKIVVLKMVFFFLIFLLLFEKDIYTTKKYNFSKVYYLGL